MQIDLDNMAELLAAVETELESFSDDLAPNQIYKAALVCEEILTNLARHADFEGRDKDVTLSLVCNEDHTLQLTFKDNSKAFNFLDRPDPDINIPIEERIPGGLGVFLSKKYARELQYHCEKGYNILKILL